MSSAASSRRSSIGNLLDVFNRPGRDSPGRLRNSDPEIEILSPPRSPVPLEIASSAQLDAETDNNPTIHYQFTKRDPMGEILLNIYEELTHLARRTNKSMTTDIDDICKKFHNHQISQSRKINHKIMQNTAEWEQSRIDRELSSCALNQRIEAPDHFSKTDKWKTPRDRADTLKLLPTGSHKFSGTHGISVVEYLYNLNQVQEQCNLSLPEFYQAMLASTTGQPYTYLMGAIRNGESPINLYHNLLIRYDKRLQPEEARIKLYAYTIPKTATLATAESYIYELAEQAVSALPEGVARTVALDYEAVQALFRALPPQSATLARNTYSQFSTKVGESISFANLSRLLNTYRYTIDSDIKLHGSNKPQFEARRNFKRPMKPYTGMKRYSAYNVQTASSTGRIEAGGNTPSPTGSDGQWRPRPGFRPQGSGGQYRSPNTGRFMQNNNARMGYNNLRVSNTNKRGGSNGRSNQGFSGRTYGNGSGYGNNSGNRGNMNKRSGFRGRTGNKFNTRPRDYCSLCGKFDHKAVDGCPYMVNDAGRKVPIMPCKDVCPACPSHIRNRLNHPSYICPFRKNGPLCDK